MFRAMTMNIHHTRPVEHARVVVCIYIYIYMCVCVLCVSTCNVCVCVRAYVCA